MPWLEGYQRSSAAYDKASSPLCWRPFFRSRRKMRTPVLSCMQQTWRGRMANVASPGGAEYRNESCFCASAVDSTAPPLTRALR